MVAWQLGPRGGCIYWAAQLLRHHMQITPASNRDWPCVQWASSDRPIWPIFRSLADMSRELCVSQGVTVVRGLPAGGAASSAGVRGGLRKILGFGGVPGESLRAPGEALVAYFGGSVGRSSSPPPPPSSSSRAWGSIEPKSAVGRPHRGDVSCRGVSTAPARRRGPGTGAGDGPGTGRGRIVDLGDFYSRLWEINL